MIIYKLLLFLSFLMIFESILPFLSPDLFKKVITFLLDQSDNFIRFFASLSLFFGFCLYIFCVFAVFVYEFY